MRRWNIGLAIGCGVLLITDIVVLGLLDWLIAILIVMAGMAGVVFWQRWRIQHHEPGNCIRCGRHLVRTRDQCRQCGVARQASFQIDVGTIIATLTALSFFVAGLIVRQKNLSIPSGLICLGALYLWHLNRKPILGRRGIGSLIRAGLIGFLFLAGLFIGWLYCLFV